MSTFFNLEAASLEVGVISNLKTNQLSSNYSQATVAMETNFTLKYEHSS